MGTFDPMGERPDPVEQLLDDVLWAIDHSHLPAHAPEATAIIIRARAHNAEWHRARAFRERTGPVVDVRCCEEPILQTCRPRP